MAEAFGVGIDVGMSVSLTMGPRRGGSRTAPTYWVMRR